jgi:hypothetical protein
VAFFVGEESGFVTAQTLWVDARLYSHPIWPYQHFPIEG